MTDLTSFSDQVHVTRTLGAVISDALSASDSVVPGFVRWTAPLDDIAANDQLVVAFQYNRDLADSLETDDSIHTWMAADRVLQANLRGTADLRAVLVERKAPGIPVGVPPRTVRLPKPAPVFIEHNVVNSNPPRREDR
jgi:hypothetical protein